MADRLVTKTCARGSPARKLRIVAVTRPGSTHSCLEVANSRKLTQAHPLPGIYGFRMIAAHWRDEKACGSIHATCLGRLTRKHR